ncbi:DNA-directed RNA polymerase subunit beta' [PVC group bacterium]|nr:DNA-directed RNA polymerase subunit beta' [PVC group bacterium]
MIREQTTPFDSVTIRIASPDRIKEWSRGEVKKPETINYRTFKPEKDGLFCEKIFGPTKDYECSCGKYKRIKHKGVTCDRCGVEVTMSKVRGDRMGHITLAAPVTHIWFFKTNPSRIGNLLDLSLRSLEKIIYFEEYVVLDPGETALSYKQLLSENDYKKCREQYGSGFKVGIGAEAIQMLMRKLDLSEVTKGIYAKIEKTSSKMVEKKHFKRLEIVEDFRKSGNKQEWMILNVIPIIPPDLRPLVPLDGGRFATSDLNDLYRRVINRNNRLKRLLELNAPDVIIRNEKRMLQEACDALFDNGKHGRPVLGSGNRPLKSLSDMLKGKQGRFRQNLLGKRVDYSGRSVIVVGPELKMHQCGLPKKMALELFEPFIIKRLKDKGYVHTIKSARKMVEKVRPEVWDILDEVIKDHPVMLNRAPTLHRLGVQAFEPVLIEGKAIRIHPLVCTAFNADFDGDQMAIHVPLSIEAQIETRVLLLSTNNIFSPANGKPVVTPTQDIVLGIYYITRDLPAKPDHKPIFFKDIDEVISARAYLGLSVHEPIKLWHEASVIETTVGRAIFNDVLPKGTPFVNRTLNKTAIMNVIMECYDRFGHTETVHLLDRLKSIGFEEATKAGISICVDDIRIPEEKEAYLKEAYAEINTIQKQYKRGLITNGERHNKAIDIWTNVTERLSDRMLEGIKVDKRRGVPLNPIFIMADSGARGSKQQIRQLAGMRGLMAKPSGEIIESPIVSNFREGLTVFEYFISAHGARKGLADTALKTADSGYLTRRLVDCAQDVIITRDNCGTLNGITIGAIVEGEENMVGLRERVVGRVALDNIVDPVTDEILVSLGVLINDQAAKNIERAGIEKIKIRSVLTCEADRGVCAKCYGTDLSTGKLVEHGTAVGIIAAQSIGEPGTQLTMRTFHIGGTASRIVEEKDIKAKNNGTIEYLNLKTVVNRDGQIIVLNRNGELFVDDKEGRHLEKHLIPSGSIILKENKETIKKGDIVYSWDPHTQVILSEMSGRVRFEDIIEDVTFRKEYDEVTGITDTVVIEHREDLYPQIIIMGDNDEILAYYSIPSEAHIVVQDGAEVQAGDLIAKTLRKVTKTRDITGGLPRVAELFEARRPKDPAIITEIDGVVRFAGTVRGMRKIIIESDTGMQKEYLVPHGKHLNVYNGDRVRAGHQLIDGPVVPQDILHVSGDRVLQEYLVNEVQEVYRLQGVETNDKHIEIIVRQMLKKVCIEETGDTKFLGGQQVDKPVFKKENQRVIAEGGKPAKAEQILLGITKASLMTDSFISAASFQETTKVLTRAAASGATDHLLGLKENVIMGHLIPAGTGLAAHRKLVKDFDMGIPEEEKEKKENPEPEAVETKS